MKKSIITCFAFLMTFGLCLGTVHAVSNVRYDWGFNKSKNEEPADAGPKYNAIVEKYGAIYKADVSITTKDGIILKRIIGRNSTHLITIDNELVPISDIIDIDFSE